MRPCPMCGSKRLKVYTTKSVQSFRRGTVKCLDELQRIYKRAAAAAAAKLGR